MRVCVLSLFRQDLALITGIFGKRKPFMDCFELKGEIKSTILFEYYGIICAVGQVAD